MFKLKSFAVSVLFCAVAAGGLTADEAAVRKFLEAYVEAFNRQDLDATAACWTTSCTHVDRATGERTEGRDAIRADLTEVFGAPLKTLLGGTIDEVRFVRPDVASIDGTTTTSIAGEDPSVSQFFAIVVLEDDRWMLGSVEESPVAPPATAADALAGLAWLEGSWVDDSNGERVVSTFNWSVNQAFLVRSISREADGEISRVGTQIIGWDPRGQQIRSWNFNADGSFGDGVWSPVDNNWIVKSSETLPDGSAASGTYLISPVDENSLTMRLMGVEVEGQPQPASEPVTIVRVPDIAEAPADTVPLTPVQPAGR